MPEHSPLNVHSRCSNGMSFSVAIRRRTSFKYSHLFLPGFIMVGFRMMRRRYDFFGDLDEILSAPNFEISKHPFELILRRQAGVAEVAVQVSPVLEPAIVE